MSKALEVNMLVRYAIQFVLLCGSAFFSGSETALFSLSHVDFQQLRRIRHRHAETLQALLDEPRRLIVSILCGNELVNIAAIANMTGILVALYGEAKAGWIAVIVMLPLLLLVGEVTPKTIAVTNPRRISAGVVAGPLWRWVRLIGPLRWVVRNISDRITTWIVGPERAAENILQIDEFRSVIEDVAESGKLDVTARTLINNLLSAGATEIVKVMTPRSSTVFLDIELGAVEMVSQFGRIRHSRVPVYRQHRDNLIGFLHEEDVVGLHLDGADFSTLDLGEVLRSPIVVPLTKTVDEMFDFFVKNDARAAAVLNEFGGVAGFITVNDVLRFIFGSLTHSGEAETSIKQVGPNAFEMPGDTKLGEMNRVTRFSVHDPRMTTIAGVAFRHLDRLPCVGDHVTTDGVTITVLAMDAHRISQVRVRRGDDGQGFAEDAGAMPLDAQDDKNDATETTEPQA
ncbi:MAG: HlyC/CorC family transporter [Pirellulaceae bacterium]|nr:HlyC/CorC family transporter [Pirellulaceae bacterium]